MESKLEKLEKFVQLLHDVQRVKRVARRPNEKVMTSTAEHTFELVMMCWYIASTNKLDLNMEKVLKCALAHDVVEAYAGDTFAYDEEAKKTKIAREAEALQQMESAFPSFTDLTGTIHEYEKHQSPEAQFVFAADKLIDVLDCSMEEKQSLWKEFDISYDTFLNRKKEKGIIATSEIIEEYWEELLKKINNKKDFFFDR